MDARAIRSLFDQALTRHRAGDAAAAAALYQQILQQDPKNADALHLLGVTALQTGDPQRAVELISQAVRGKRNEPSIHNNLGEAYRALGSWREAADAYVEALRLDPHNGSICSNYSIALFHLGRRDEALAAARRAIDLNPQNGAAYLNLGNLLAEIDPSAALHAYERAAERVANPAGVYLNAARLLGRIGDVDQAITVARHALSLDPTSAEANVTLAWALLNKMDPALAAEALQLSRTALAYDASNAGAHTNAGFALDLLKELGEAEASFDRAAALAPASGAVWRNLGVARMKLGRFAEARDAFDRAIAIDDDDAEAHANRALALLSLGDYAKGFEEYEWRWRWPSFVAENPRPAMVNEWDGSDPAGKTIHLLAEQGLGDTIFAIRYARLLVERGARVVVTAGPALHGLLESMEGIEVMAEDGPTPASDVQVSLLSLPQLFRTTAETIPAPIPYLRALPDKVAKFRGDAGGVKIGLCYAGNPRVVQDRTRSMAFGHLLPLFELPGVTFHLVQLTAPPAEIPNLKSHISDLHDLTDTAGLMSNMDLILTTDTVIAHLAGALGLQTWVMLSLGCDWRYLLEAERTPWYPTMRLFRQTAPNDWAGVLARVIEALRAEVLR